MQTDKSPKFLHIHPSKNLPGTFLQKMEFSPKEFAKIHPYRMAAINRLKIKSMEEMLMWHLFFFFFCPSENWVWSGEEKRV